MTDGQMGMGWMGGMGGMGGMGWDGWDGWGWRVAWIDRTDGRDGGGWSPMQIACVEFLPDIPSGER